MDKGRNGGIDPDQCAQSGGCISALWSRPQGPSRAGLILAHGAGAPMDSPFMEQIAVALSARAITVARFEFEYMAARRLDGKRRPPNPQASLLAQWKQAYRYLAGQMPGPVAIGGKSMGGRMASLLAEELQVPALVCLGYPFHPTGKPEKTRVAHLATIQTPTLIVQGTRDSLGTQAEVAAYSLASPIRLHWLEGADHDLKPLKSTGCSHGEYLERAAEAVAAFLISHLG